MIEAIAAIEYGTGAIGFKNGELILKDSKDMARFVKLTKGKTLICGARTYETLPSSLRLDEDRPILLFTRKSAESLFELLEKPDPSQSYMIIGGAKTYEMLEQYVDTWYLTWFLWEFNAVQRANLVYFRPNLTDFEETEKIIQPSMCFSTYDKIKSATSTGVLHN